MPRIVELLVSPLHRYEGRPADGPAPVPDGAPDDELVGRIAVRARLGITGDRYFGKTAHRDAAVTLIASESLPPGVGLIQVRRNILLQGVDVDSMVGRTLTLDSGSGPVSFEVRRRANPCAWMDVVIGPGAFRALRGRGGIRCVPVNDGELRLGPVDVVTS
ncbi:molybdenum cofactor biosysynthesis protein [Kineosporia sp. J2-2]|uniref:Molybdenum cofactor biosysynthesis protein n=1 Tax=Kineosporia corallincola TaxID=2835133 RepID=A0ABS5TTL4_9ACTN|nr:molybdenum cofactor biosysynthesis protein [Kineosporia corallincola]MBT0774084.1 molybdenum cofactor biosysynthesis protein [Kineosporia corallincola]